MYNSVVLDSLLDVLECIESILLIRINYAKTPRNRAYPLGFISLTY